MNQLNRAEMKHLATHICVNMHRMSNTFPEDVASEQLCATTGLLRNNNAHCVNYVQNLQAHPNVLL